MKQKLLLSFAVVVSVFAVLLIADHVMAGTIFLPLINGGNANPAAVPSGILYVFNSAGTTNGNAGGRSGMNAICAATDASSHFCNYREIRNALDTTGVIFSPTFNTAWLDNVANDTDWAIENCGGWTLISSANSPDEPWASIMLANGQSRGYGTCQTAMWVTCCKWLP